MVSTPFDQTLVTLATWVLLGCACWAALLGLAVLVEAGTAGRVRATAWVGCPPRLRHALLATLGLVLVTGGATTPALGAAQPAGARAGSEPTTTDLPVPARPSGVSAARQRAPSLVVRPGDSLWRLAADRAGPQASGGEIAALVQRFHHRNRRVIGPDPDLLHPGQRLTVPALGHHRRDRSHEERP